jgi:hypothetical protein
VRRAPLVLALVLLLPACRHSTSPTPGPSVGAEDARARLAVLANATAVGEYDATYRFVQQGTNAKGTIRIRQRPPYYRIDIATKDIASFFSLHSGTVSCSRKGKKKTCFLVARPGEPVPALFDPGVQRLFRDAVIDLAANPDQYVVTRVPASPSPSVPGSVSASASGSTSASASPSASPSTAAGVPDGECFLVNRPRATASSATKRIGFENGTYCFSVAGVATRIEVASGSLTLIDTGRVPPWTAFKPIAKVVKLPTLKPLKPKK